MRKTNKRTIAIIAAVLAVIVLAVILLLFFLNDKGSDTPDTSPTPGISDTTTPGTTPDNSTPPGGDTTTPDITTPQPGTSEPSETPGENNPPDTPTPTLRHPIDDPNVTPHPDSPYAYMKSEIDMAIGYFNLDYNIDIDKTIEEAYAKYGDLIDKDVINPVFARIVITICGGGSTHNAFRLNDMNLETVNSLLDTNGFEQLGFSRGNMKPGIEAGMIYLSTLAKEEGYGSDDLDELFCDCYAVFWPIKSERIALFYEYYYPWLSKDAP